MGPLPCHGGLGLTKRRDAHPDRRSSAGETTPSGSTAPAPPAGIRTVFRWFWPATQPYRRRLLLSLLLVAFVPFLEAAQTWMFKLLIDDVLTPRDFHAFPPIAAGYLGIGLALGLVSFVDEWLSSWLGQRFVLDLRTRLFSHLHKLSVDFFDRRQLGDTLSRLTGDIDAIEQLVLSGVTRTLSYAFQILLFTGALFYLNWHLGLAALIAAPAFLMAARHFSPRTPTRHSRACAATDVAQGAGKPDLRRRELQLSRGWAYRAGCDHLRGGSRADGRARWPEWGRQVHAEQVAAAVL